ncbi:MAG: hypothetical protein FJX64_08630 [Alphaproteobacteria bacterium]|nr:hypothetical protein [Alphaproteobacteria bacterium]
MLDDLVPNIIAVLIVLWPVWRVCRRAGIHPAWALMLFVPYAGFLLVYLMLAFRRWPATSATIASPR